MPSGPKRGASSAMSSTGISSISSVAMTSLMRWRRFIRTVFGGLAGIGRRSDETAIDFQGNASDIAGILTRKEENRRGDLIRPCKTPHRGFAADGLDLVLAPAGRQRALDMGGADGIDGDAEPRALLGQTLRESEHAR